MVIALGAAFAAQTAQMRTRLENPSVLTGWVLLAFLGFLAFFNVRKRLSMLPLGHATRWRSLHEWGGLVALFLFWLHTGTFWPKGFYEQILAVFFYVISASGCVGSILGRVYPSRLTRTGIEIIYERIPEELAALRSQTESLVLASHKRTASGALVRDYETALHWFFARPRFFWCHLFGTSKADSWIRSQFAAVRNTLGAEEQSLFEKLKACADLKNKMDFHYAVQTALKAWLFSHVPLAAGLLVLVFWHVMLVHIYLL